MGIGIGNKLNDLLSERGMTVTELARKIDVAPTTIYSIIQRNNKKVDIDVLIKIARVLGVNAEYFGDVRASSDDHLTAKDNRDIAKDLDNIMAKLSSGENGPAAYNGEELDPEAAELFKEELEIALRRLKLINKEKYTPKKYKK